MGKPMRTNNPSEWTALDGIYIDELRPPGKISNLGSAVVAVIGQFQRGPYDATTIGSSKQLIDLFGSGDYGGFNALLGKTFSNLVVKRIKSSGSKSAFGYLIDNGEIPANSIKVSAKYEGSYGNEITVKTLTATSAQNTEVNLLVTYGAVTELIENVSLAKLTSPISGELVDIEKATLIYPTKRLTVTGTVVPTEGNDIVELHISDYDGLGSTIYRIYSFNIGTTNIEALDYFKDWINNNYGSYLSAVRDVEVLTISRDTTTGTQNFNISFTGANSGLTGVITDPPAAGIAKVGQTVSLTQGSNGAVATIDYSNALTDLEAYDGLTLIIADQGTEDINLAIIAHCNKMGDRVPILHLPKGTTKSQAITAISQLRSAADRGILAWPWVYQYNMYKDVTELSNPAAWAASLISQIPEEWDPAIADGAKYITGIKGLEFPLLTRQDYIELKNAGIMAWEFDKDIGYKIKSGVTMSTDPVLAMVFRRRMSDKLTSEVASGLKPYQNKPNTEDNQADALGAVTRYLQDYKDKKRIKNFIVDGDSMNTNTSLANGEFHILMMVQLYSSMRYIVLHAQVGETVLIVQEVNNNVG